MTTLNPSRIVGSVGVAPKTLYNGVYTASVVANNDTTGKGRVTLRIPQVLGIAVSNWAIPMGISVTNVPAVGTVVYSGFLGGDINHPVYWSTSSSIITNTLTAGEIDLTQVATPSTPSSGVKLWSDTNGKFNFKGTNGLAELAQALTVDGGITTTTVKATSTSEFDGTITLKNGSASSTVSMDSTDGHPVLSQGLQLSQISTPATPASGVRMWSDTGGRLNFKGTSGGAEFVQPITFDGALTATGGTQSTPTNIQTDTWHTATLINNWTSNIVMKYKMLPFSAVHLAGVIVGTSATNATFMTLTGNYVPTTQQETGTGLHGAQPVGGSFLRVDTSGNVSVVGGNGTTGPWDINWIFSLDYA